MSSRTKSAEGGAVRSLLTLFSNFGRKKKEKQEKHAAQAAAADAGEPKLRSSPQNPVDTEEQLDEKVIITEAIHVSEACVSKQEAHAASDEPNELTNSAPLEPQQPFERQDKLFAALESSADQQLTGTRPSFHVADLSSLLFTQRTETQSGNCMALPSRVANAFASGAQSGEGNVMQRIRTDGHQGSYLPYGTTTVGPMISAVNNANIDISAISGQNLQDMLYADYEMLDDDRLHNRLERASGRGFVVASGAVRREHTARAPHVPSLLGREPLQPHTTPPLDQLEADRQERSGTPPEAPVFPSVGPQRMQQPTAEQEGDVVELGCGSRSEPLGQVQLPQLDQHLGSDGHRAQPHTQHQKRDAVQEQQQQLEMTAPVAGTWAMAANAKGIAADPAQPSSPAHPTGNDSGTGGFGSARFRQVHLHAQHMHPPPHHRSLSPEADPRCQGAAVGLELEAPTHSSQPPALQNPQSLPSLPFSSPILTQPVASEHPQQESHISKGGEAGNDALPPPQPSDQYPSAHAHRLVAQAHQTGSGQGPSHPSIQGAKAAEASATRTPLTMSETIQSGNMGAGPGASGLAGAPSGQDTAQPLVGAAALSQVSPGATADGPGLGAGQIPSGAAPPPAATPVPGSALGANAALGGPSEQLVPLSRPMKLTTACLAAYTTLYDFGADQSFQRALRRKMQLVYKWLHASDLTVPPDPRLEVLPSLAELRPEAAEGPSTHKASVSTAGGSGRVPPVGLPELVSRDANSSWMTTPGDHSSVVGDGDGAGSRMLAYVIEGPAAPVNSPAVGSMAGAMAGQQIEFAAQWLPSSVREGMGGRAGEAKQDSPQTAPSGPVAGLQPSTTPPVLQHSYHGSGRVNHHLSSISNTHAHRNPQHGSASEKTYSATMGIAGRPAEGSGGADGTQRPSGWHSMPYNGHDRAQLRPSVHCTLGPPLGVAPTLPQRRVGTSTPQTAQAAVAGAVTITGESLQPSQAPHPASLHTQTGSQPLQHSLSDLYGNSSALRAGANLPPRVLAASDDINGVMTSPPPAAATPPGGSAGPQEHSRVSRSGGGPPPSSSHATGSGPGAVPTRTKTIAVASHCPLELQPQSLGSSWSIDDFTLLKKLYEGSLSVVCQAQHKRCGRHVALKIYKRSRLHEMERFQLAREICLHIRIVHPHVVALYAAWKDSKYVYLAMDWAPQGNMFDYLVARGGQLSEEEAARMVMRPILSALAFLHSQHFIHRDVKLENLILDASCQLKLADFGLAIDQKFEQANTRLGTFGYFAPEVLDCPLKKGPFDLKDTSVPGYDCRVDVWSAGVVAYEVLTGRAPFSASSPAKIIQAIRSRELEFPGVSEEGQDFLRSALTRDPAARPTAKQLLEHPWIVRHCGANAANAAVGSITPSATITRETTKVTPSPAGWVVDAAGGAAAGGVGPNAAPGASAVGRGN